MLQLSLTLMLTHANIQQTGLSPCGPVDGNKSGSYLTMLSAGGVMFGCVNVVGNLGTVRVFNMWFSGVRSIVVDVYTDNDTHELVTNTHRSSWTNPTGNAPSRPAPPPPSKVGGWGSIYIEYNSAPTLPLHTHPPPNTTQHNKQNTTTGYLLGGLAWFAIPFALATSLGLACLALELPISVTQANAGLVPVASALELLGSGGAWMIICL